MAREALKKEIRDFLRQQFHLNGGGMVSCDLGKLLLDFAEPREKRIADLEAQIEKMKCCENCKYNSYWGNELHCNYGLKEALQEDKLVECNKMDKWEIKEK